MGERPRGARNMGIAQCFGDERMLFGRDFMENVWWSCGFPYTKNMEAFYYMPNREYHEKHDERMLFGRDFMENVWWSCGFPYT